MYDRETDIHFMQLALEQARKAEAEGEVPVGAVVVRDGEVIASGYNQTIANHDPSGHAEIIALRRAGQYDQNHRLNHASIYVSLEPCIMCAGAILHARLERLIFAARDERYGAAGSQLNLLESVFLNHRTTITAGVLGDQSRAVLQDFFKQRR